MQSNAKLHKKTLFLLVLARGGCAAPPSVVPLLRVVDQALTREANRLAEDGARDVQFIEQTRRSLEAAFDADLLQTDQLSVQWVRDAVGVYVSAQEALLRHEMKLQTDRGQQKENLLAAAQAQRRAISLIEQQDQLITQAVGFDLWRILSNPNTNNTENR